MTTFRVFLNEPGRLQVTDDISALPVIEVEVGPDDRVMDVAQRAATEAGIDIDRGQLLFPTLPDAKGWRETTGGPAAFVAEDGKWSWTEYAGGFPDLTVGDMQRSHRDGVFDGDPDAIIWERQVGGDGDFARTWQQLIDALIVIGGVAGGIEVIRRLARRGADIIRREPTEQDLSSAAAWLAEFIRTNHHRWDERGATPYAFLDGIVRKRSWDAGLLRRLLDIDPMEAHRMLEILGYDYRPASKLHELSDNPRRRRFRREVLDRFLGWDPTTWDDDRL